MEKFIKSAIKFASVIVIIMLLSTIFINQYPTIVLWILIIGGTIFIATFQTCILMPVLKSFSHLKDCEDRKEPLNITPEINKDTN